MPNSLLINLSALIALLPASLLAMRHDARRDIVFWLLLGVALAGATTQTIVNSADGWRSDVASALWLSITASLAIFSVICVFVRDAWRLAPLFSPYMLGLGLCAVAWGSTKAHDVLTPLSGVGTWIGLHIFVSVSTYGLVTIAAIAALGAIVQERALKAKTQTSLSKRLPALTDCDRLVIRLLGLGEAILALGLISGMAVQTYETGSLFSLTHNPLPRSWHPGDR